MLIVWIFFGSLAAAILFMFGAAIYEVSPAARRKEARAYADWLASVYPDLAPNVSAAHRLRELTSASYYRSERDREECRLARLVVDGWHLE